MAMPPIDEKTKANLARLDATAKFKAFMATQKTQMELEQARQATQAAAMDAVNQARERLRKEKEAQEQKAQQQSQKGGETEPATDVLGDNIQINPQNSTGNVQGRGFEGPKFGGGNGPFPSGPGVAGGSTDDMMGLPPVGEAPPFLVSQRQQSEVGPHRFSPYFTAPARTTRRTTDIQPNVLDAGERARLIQQRAFNQRRLQQQGQRDLVSSFRDLAEITGDSGVAAGAAVQFRQGNTEKAFEILAKSGETLPAQIAKARVAAANSTAQRNLLTISKRQLEIRRLRAELEDLPLERAGKVAALVKTLSDSKKIEAEIGAESQGSLSDRYGYPSSPVDARLDNSQFNLRVKELFRDPTGAWRVVGGKRTFDPTVQANADGLQVEAFNRGYLLSIKENDSKRVPIEDALGWLDDVYRFGTAPKGTRTEDISRRAEVAAKNLSDLGFSRGNVFNEEEHKAKRATADLFLGPDDDDIANATTSDLLRQHWVSLRLGSGYEAEEVSSLAQEAENMIKELLSQGAQ